MAKYGSADVAFWLGGGYDLLGYQTDLDVKGPTKETEETHVLGDSWTEHELVDLQRMEVSQKGFYDDIANGNNAALLANVGTAVVLCLGVEGNTVGKQF